jgi:hypothetical protein
VKKLLLLFFTFCTIIHAQAYEITWSRELDDNNRFSYLKILGATENGYFILRSNVPFDNIAGQNSFKSRRFLLQFYTTALNLSWEKEVQPTQEDAKVVDLQSVGDRVLMVSYNDKPSGSGYEVFAQYINQDGSLQGSPVLMEEFPFIRFDDDRRPAVVFSKDRSVFAFAYRKADKNDTEQTIVAVVMDSSLQRRYRREWNIASPIRRFSPTHFLLTNESDFYVLGVQYLTEKRVKLPGESYFMITGFHQASDRFISRDIRLEGKFLTDISIADDVVNHRLAVAGFYSETGMLASAGVFYTSLVKDSLTDTTIYFAPFTEELLQKSITDRNDFRKKEVYNYYIDRLLLRKDGGAAVIAESYVESSRTFWDYYTQTMITHTYYRYGNIIAASFNPSGGMLWSKVIQKEQNSMDDDGYQSSYCSQISGGRFYAIFNKFIDRRSSVMICWIDGQGNQKTDVLFEEGERITVIARAAKQVDGETMIIPAYRQNRFHLVKVTF